MPKPPASKREKSEAIRQAEVKLANIRKLEKVGMRVLSDSEMNNQREQLRKKIRQLEDAAYKFFEEYGDADRAFHMALLYREKK